MAKDQWDFSKGVIKANTDDKEMELVILTVNHENTFTLFEDLDETEQEYFNNRDFVLFDPDSLN